MLRSRGCWMMICLVLAAATSGVRAEDAPKPEKPARPKAAKTVGTVASVEADALTVTPRAKKARADEAAAEPEPRTFTVGERTKVRVDGKEAALADVAAGYAVVVMATADGEALKINAVSPEEQARRAEAKKARAQEKAKDKAGDGDAEGEM